MSSVFCHYLCQCFAYMHSTWDLDWTWDPTDSVYTQWWWNNTSLRLESTNHFIWHWAVQLRLRKRSAERLLEDAFYNHENRYLILELLLWKYVLSKYKIQNGCLIYLGFVREDWCEFDTMLVESARFKQYWTKLKNWNKKIIEPVSTFKRVLYWEFV